MSSLKNEKFFKILVIIFAFFFIGVGLVAAKTVNLFGSSDSVYFWSKVGVKKTPVADLDVYGSFGASGAVQLGALGNSGVVLLKADNDGNLSTQATTTLPVAAGNVIAGNFGANVGNGNYTFPGNLDVNGITKFVYNVGIGTTNPLASAFLHIKTPADLTNHIYLEQANGAGGWALNTEGTKLHIISNYDGSSDYRVNITSSGYVGIGTTTPPAILSVNGPIYLQATTTPSPTTGHLYNSGGNLYWSGSQLGSGGGPNYWTLSGSNLYASTTSWNVSIGTNSNPSNYKLNVDGSEYITGDTNTYGLVLHSSVDTGGYANVDFFSVAGGTHLDFTGSANYNFDGDVNITNDKLTASRVTVNGLSEGLPVFTGSSGALGTTGSYGAMYISTSGATTITTGGTYVPVAGTYTLLYNNNFSLGADSASLKYTGATTQKFLVTVSLSATSSVGSGWTVYFRLTENGANNTIYIQSFKIYSTYGQNVSLSGIFTLSTNEYVGVYTTASKGSKTVTVSKLNMQITPLGG